MLFRAPFLRRFTPSLSAFLALAAANAAIAGGHSDVISLDQRLLARFCGETLTSPEAMNFALEGYDFRATSEVWVDDSFVISVGMTPPAPRRIRFGTDGASVDRRVSEADVAQVRDLARQAVLEGYAGVIQPEIIRAVDEVEATIAPAQVTFGVVRDLRTGEIVGANRVVRAVVRDGKVILPSLEVMRRRGLLTPGDEARIRERLGFREARGQATLSARVQEIGQFFIDKRLRAAGRELVRKRLLLWLAARSMDPADGGGIALMHTSSLAHERRWRQFGFSSLIAANDDDPRIPERIRAMEAPALYAALLGAIDEP